MPWRTLAHNRFNYAALEIGNRWFYNRIAVVFMLSFCFCFCALLFRLNGVLITSS